VLTITLAKKAEAKPRQIKIELGAGNSAQGSSQKTVEASAR
jgi:hypothetical protein